MRARKRTVPARAPSRRARPDRLRARQASWPVHCNVIVTLWPPRTEGEKENEQCSRRASRNRIRRPRRRIAEGAFVCAEGAGEISPRDRDSRRRVAPRQSRQLPHPRALARRARLRHARRHPPPVQACGEGLSRGRAGRARRGAVREGPGGRAQDRPGAHRAHGRFLGRASSRAGRPRRGAGAVLRRQRGRSARPHADCGESLRADLRGPRSRAPVAPRPDLAAARPDRREVPRREPHRRPAHLLRRFAAFLRLRREQRDGVPPRLGHRGRRRRSRRAKRGVPRGAQAGRALRALGRARRRAALLDRGPDRRAREPLRILRAAAAAFSAGAAVMGARAASLLLALGFALSCAAQTYPSRAVRIVVAFPAGGGSDLAARVVAQKLSESLGQPVVVENRVGANGSVGAEAVARAAPDGYTLVMGSNANITTNPHLMSLAYDPMKDLAPVAMLTVNPLLLFVNPAVVPVRSFAEFLDYVRAQNGRADYASAGNGSPAHLSGELLKLTAGSRR